MPRQQPPQRRFPQQTDHARYTQALSTVAVAQLVESQIVILVVVGSSPISHPKNVL